MPWEHADALKHNSNADTPEKQKIWAEVANKALESSGDDGAAIRAANSVLKHMAEKTSEPAVSTPRIPGTRRMKSNLGAGMKPHWPRV